LIAKKIVLAVVLGVLAAATAADGADFDGSKPLLGITGKIVEINPYKIIEDVDPDTVGLPRNFRIDFEAKRLRPSKDSRVQTAIAFERVEFLENMLVIQGLYAGVAGVEDGLAWSLTISRRNGNAVLSASGDGRAYVVFGTCTPAGGGRPSGNE